MIKREREAVVPLLFVASEVTGPIPGSALRAELCLDEPSRQRGLMHRLDLPFPDGAVVLCYPRAARLGVWMKDTTIPLSAGFLDEDKRLLSVVHLAPRDLAVHYSPKAARYVLETHRGWFSHAGVYPGCLARFEIPGHLRIT